ncbi:MAG TPA: AI-2E family transporter, partial [Hydrogenophaga sp.]|nr:AI-2E family transporter [Hydrogenophaga sp.]
MPELPRSSQSPFSVLLGAAALVIVIGGLKMAAPVVVPFLLAVMLAIILIPPLNWLMRRGVHLVAAMVLLSIGLVLIWLPMAAILGAAFDALAEALPGYQDRVQEMVATAADWLEAQGFYTARTSVQELLDPEAAL